MPDQNQPENPGETRGRCLLWACHCLLYLVTRYHRENARKPVVPDLMQISMTYATVSNANLYILRANIPAFKIPGCQLAFRTLGSVSFCLYHFLNFHNTKVRNQAFKIVSESLMIVSKKVTLNLLLNKEILKIAFNKNASNRLILRRCYFLLWMKVELQEFALTYFKLPTNYNLGASNRKLITVSMFSTNSTCFI